MIISLGVVAVAAVAVYAVKNGITVAQIKAEVTKVEATASADVKALVTAIKAKL